MVASPRLNSFMKSAIVFWCSATLGTSILENRSYSVRKMDHGRIECPPASATEIEKKKMDHIIFNPQFFQDDVDRK